MPTSAGSCRNGTVRLGPLSTSVKLRRLVAGGASGFVAEQTLAALRCRAIEAVFRRLRGAQTQLIVQQGRQLRGDEIRRLRDEEADAGIAEVALPAHLPDPHVAVPIRDRPIGGERLEADPLQSIDRREDNRQRGTVQ